MEAYLARAARMDFRMPLGAILSSRGLISIQQLNHALDIQERDGARLGDILISEGLVGYYDLYNAVAESHNLPFVNLLHEPPQPELLNSADTDTYLALRIMPWRREKDCICIAVCEVTLEVMVYIRQWFGANTRLVITSPFDIKRTVERHFGPAIEKESCLSLWKNHPEASAYTTVSASQKYCLAMLSCALILMAFLKPVLCVLLLIMVCHIGYALTMLFKHLIFMNGCKTHAAGISNHDIDPPDLPVYSVLIPMYREAESLPGMLQAMSALDYPASKLDIKLVLEADDHDTLATACLLKPRYQFDIIRVPPGQPRTKPKACNYAMRFAHGEFITIFDADDRPEPSQLKKAVHAFRTLPNDVVCLQAPLNYYNANDNLLTRFFALEYSMLFRVLLKGLECLGIPIPLGGTSNHIALDRLKMLGAWDPFNVTEDADLGTRLAAQGLRTAMLDSYTMEEAPNRNRPWIKQRSRWIKGYMQTWLVHMRAPVILWRNLGWKSFLGFQCFIGLSTFTFLSAPVLWILALAWLSGQTSLSATPFPNWLGWLTMANLGVNAVTHWYYTGYCAWHFHQRDWRMALAVLAFPLYLFLHSIASYKALWQLIAKPHFWEKTTHGLARTIQIPSLS